MPRMRFFSAIESRTVTFALAVYFCIALNFVLAERLFDIITALDHPSWLFIASIPLTFLAAFTLLFSLFVWKPLTKPLFSLLLVTSSVVNYAAHQFGILFNKDMMVNIFETTPAEAASYLNVKLILWIAATGFLPAILLVFTPISYRRFGIELRKKMILIAVCVAILFGIGSIYYKDYASIARNNPKLQKNIVPTYFIGSTIKYINERFFTTPLAYNTIGTDAKRLTDGKEKYLVVVLVGETARGQNYQLNGYNRATNAYTTTIPNVISFPHVSSCGTATAVSLPCMFSLLGQKNYSLEKAESQDNVVDVINHAGYKAAWIDNNTGCKGVCHKIESYATVDVPKLNCTGEECTDQVFLNVLDDTIKGFKNKDGVIFMHMIGSHGPTYFKRYPKDKAVFQPDCATSDLQKCTDEEIVNAYDNTILFTDYVMAQIIARLKTYANSYYTAVVYMSDHGESLGENGVYLHGMPYQFAPDQQTHVPFIFWLSDGMLAHKQIDMNCLKRKADSTSFSHDNLPHTLLNLLDIRTKEYNNHKDVLASCEKENLDLLH